MFARCPGDPHACRPCLESLHRPGTEVLARGTYLAGGLRRLGLQEGDVVAVLLRNDPVFADVIFACRTRRHLSPDQLVLHGRGSARFLLEDKGARALIAHAGLAAGASAVILPGVPCWPWWQPRRCHRI